MANTPSVPEADSVSDEDRQRGERYARIIERLVAADCPNRYPFGGADHFGEAIEFGQTIHIRTIENCLSKQIDVLTPTVATLLNDLYEMHRRTEREVAPPHMDSVLTNGLVAVQEAWLQSREAQCEYEADQYLGGTGASYAWLSCNVAALKRHREWAENGVLSASRYSDE